MTSPLYDLESACTACSLRATCTAPVPADGPLPAAVVLVGEAPGKTEDEGNPRRPFQGDAGKYLDSLLSWVGVQRSQCLVTNTVKCRPQGNRTPTPEEARVCADKWVRMELGLASPRVVATLGAAATRYFLGEEFTTMDHLHGIPIQQDKWTLLPVYHPAAALHQTSLARQVNEDFRVLGRLVRGGKVETLQDKFPHPNYTAAPRVYCENLMALDTEIVEGKLWSIQVTDAPGMGILLPPDTQLPETDYVVHNYLFDADWVDIPGKVQDTMVAAYLLGLPQGLKELAWRLCGMHMESYQEIVRPYRHQKAMDYLRRVEDGPEGPNPNRHHELGRTGNGRVVAEHRLGGQETDPPWVSRTIQDADLDAGQDIGPGHQDKLEWLDPPELEETKWDKKTNSLVTRIKKPAHITRKVKGIIRDVEKGKVTKEGPTDPYARWHKIDERERAVVEDVLGPMPDGDLSDCPPEVSRYYACRDADATIRVHQVLQEQLREWGLQEIYDLDTATLPIALEMQRNGVKIDVGHMERLAAEYLELMRQEAEECERLAGHGFNPNSDRQVAQVVYEELGYPPTKYTETGMPSCTSEELKKVPHPIIPHILQYRHLAHIRDSFCVTLPKWADERSRVHPTVKVTRTETGRWSMAEPNLMQIPTRTDIGKAVRDGFVAEDGWMLYAADYSQIEMRVAAHLTGCKSMIQLFQEGRDVHTETAAQVFGVSLQDAAQSRYRYPCKTLGFGVLYGLTAHGLQNQMVENGLTDWDKEKCQSFIRDYYRLRPEVQRWQDDTIAFARRNGYVKDMFGRIRFIPEMRVPIKRVSSAGERQAINMPVQSTAQGIIKKAMVQLQEARKYMPEFRWLLQIHDEIVLECPEDKLDLLSKWVISVMENVVQLSMPILCESKRGFRWGQMK